MFKKCIRGGSKLRRHRPPADTVPCEDFPAVTITVPSGRNTATPRPCMRSPQAELHGPNKGRGKRNAPYASRRWAKEANAGPQLMWKLTSLPPLPGPHSTVSPFNKTRAFILSFDQLPAPICVWVRRSPVCVSGDAWT